MNAKVLIRWFYETIFTYNLFIPEENEEGDHVPTTIQHQRYATRLYVLLLILAMYIIFFTVFVYPQTETVTILHITPSLFNQLRSDHGETLSCPCSTTFIAYENFVLNNLSIDPLCSSIFVSEQWIQSLYVPVASSFLMMDFRTTAYSQFKLLAAFCILAQEMISQVLTDIDHQQLVSIELLTNDNVQSQVAENIKLMRANTYVQMSSSLTFMRIIARSNSLISALNTNAHFSITAMDNETFLLAIDSTVYYRKNMPMFVYTKGIYSCNLVNSIVPTGFYSIPYGARNIYDNYWPDTPLSSTSFNISNVIDGYFSGCTVLDGLFVSTLDCLYSPQCLEQLTSYFPDLNQTFNFTNSHLSPNHQSSSFYERLSDLFIRNWSSTINYSKYFNNCAPLLCTFTATNQASLSYTIIFLLSLYGGLAIIFRLIAPILIHILLTFKIQAPPIQETLQWVKQINLFKSFRDPNIDSTKKQYLITRIYLMLLAGAILTLLLFTSLSTHVTTMPVPNPSAAVYRNLHESHQDTLKCPCSTTTVPYRTFISLSPSFHQVCSSDFVSDAWITLLSLVRSGSYDDWLTRAVHQFRLLSTVCNLVNTTIFGAVQRLITRSLVTFNVLTENDFNTQLNTTVNQFIQSTVINFGLLLDTVHLSLRTDQPFKVPYYLNTLLYRKVDKLYNPDSWKLLFSLTGMFNATGIFNNCVCAINPYCQRQHDLYSRITTSNDTRMYTITHTMPGSIDGCYALDSFLFSTLECFYSNSNCLSTLLTYMNMTYNQLDTEIPWFSPTPLDYDPLSNDFLPNSSFSVITKEMMIEQWNYTASFDQYYETCAPNYCTYSYTARTYNYIGVIAKIISTIGGLVIALRLITPQLVTFLYRIFEPKIKASHENQMSFFTRMKILLQSFLKSLYTELVNLTIFPSYNFGHVESQKKAKRLNQWASRLYVLVLIIGIGILSLQTLIQPETLTKTFARPSLEMYTHLLQEHGDLVHCPCSITSSTYGKYIKIEPIFHQICSSEFVSEEWRMNTTAGLISNLFDYDRRDYRRFLSAHLHYLAGLCYLSNQAVNAFIQQILSSLFVTIQLLPKLVLNTQIEALIEQNESNVPAVLLRLISLYRNINHANAIVSAYGTNYDYLLPDRFGSRIIANVMRTQGIVYDENCSCDMNASCTIPANLIQRNSSEIIPIQGLRMGCTPSESFLASTLECFYNSSCINLIYKYINYSSNANYTNVLKSPSMNATVSDLISNLFIDDWSLTINYSLYFNQCLPTVCSYTYVQKLNSLYTITRLLGLCGGLTVVLKWICPILTCLLAKIFERRKKRIKRISPIYFIPSGDNQMTADIHHITHDCLLQRHTIIFGIGFLVLLITIITIPTVYLIQREKNASLSTVSMMKTTTLPTYENISRTTSFVAKETECQLAFESRIIFSQKSSVWLYFFDIGDFNEDSYLDLVVLTAFNNNITILPNNGNETFGASLNILNITALYGTYIVVADVNNDSRLDLVTSNSYTSTLQVLLGTGNGSFEQCSLVSLAPSNQSMSMTAADFNDDGRLDLISSNYMTSYLGIVFGVDNGTFENRMTLSTGNSSGLSSIIVGDLNNDHYLDFVAVDAIQNNLKLFLGNGDGTFQNQTTILMEYNSYLGSLVAADFNNDNCLDIVILDILNRRLNVFLGYGNASFKSMLSFTTGHYNTPRSLVAADFNGDRYLDVAFANDFTGDIGIMLGNGNGTFKAQTRYSVGNSSTPELLKTGDFNNDGRLDMAVGTFASAELIILWNTCECC
ncbi:unnamed protein product [Adineta ricciae]|uniref:Uncharacterized protein n=1 Tax=Adineta ricciae TaxID=249248 RepID=A0A814QBR2_ADIRI|nr:unnamed protein product [Adineta ricciae]CAF1536781.1 unnamed protein product [Adineta ricciae]